MNRPFGVLCFCGFGNIARFDFACRVDLIFPHELVFDCDGSIFKVKIAPFQTEQFALSKPCEQTDDNAKRHQMVGVMHSVNELYDLFWGQSTILIN